MTTLAAAMGPDISFEQVSLTVGGACLLNNIDLRIEAGTLHCLLGPNGAGKTSLLRCLLGQAAHTGRIQLHWRGVARTIGYVPQTLDFDRTLPITAENFLTLVVQLRPAFFGVHRTHRAQIDALLAMVGLSGRRDTPLGKLSGGELKRLQIAQAFAPSPAVLVMDEPLNHLDREGAQLAAELFLRAKQAGTTIVCTHHDLARASELADAVTCLGDGRLQLTGPPAAVLTPENILRLFGRKEAA